MSSMEETEHWHPGAQRPQPQRAALYGCTPSASGPTLTFLIDGCLLDKSLDDLAALDRKARKQAPESKRDEPGRHRAAPVAVRDWASVGCSIVHEVLGRG